MSFFARIVADAHAAPREQAPLRIAVAPMPSSAVGTVADTSVERLFWPPPGQSEDAGAFAAEREAPAALGSAREDRRAADRQNAPAAPAMPPQPPQWNATSANEVDAEAKPATDTSVVAALSSAQTGVAATLSSVTPLANERDDHRRSAGHTRTVSPSSVATPRDSTAAPAGAGHAAQRPQSAPAPLDDRGAVVAAASPSVDDPTSALPAQSPAAVPGRVEQRGVPVGASTAAAVAAAANAASVTASRSPAPSSPSARSSAPATVRIDHVDIVVDSPPERPKRREPRARPDSSASRSYRRSV